ncbi:hypothetical protein H0H93_011859, partial [Arthromyces matolae]
LGPAVRQQRPILSSRTRPNDSTAAMERRVTRLSITTGLGTRCAITRHKLGVQYAHILAKISPAETLDTLEFSWALPYRTLNTNSRYNIIKLDATLHTILDRKKLILLPQEEDVRRLLRLYGLKEDADDDDDGTPPPPPSHRVNPSTIYDEVATYEYTILGSLEMGDHVITRLDSNGSTPLGPTTVQTHIYPYETLGSFSTTVRPHFMVCHIGRLLDPDGKDPHMRNLKQDVFGLYGVNSHLILRIIDCARLWAHWRKSSPTQQFFASPAHGESATHKSDVTSQRRAPSTVAKRTRSGIPFTIQHDPGVESSPEEAPPRKKGCQTRPREPSPSDRASRRG